MTSEERSFKFNEELEVLKKKYNFNVAAQAFITPEGVIASRAVLVDATPKEEAPKEELATP